MTAFQHSAEIAGLAAALCEAQGELDPHVEAPAIRAVVRATRPIDRTRGRTTLQRFWACVALGVNECWYWTGYLDDLGYGRTGTGILGECKAHRFSYRLFKGDIPAGEEIMHSCDVRCCVNPAHLSVGTHAENIADMVGKGRQRGGISKGENNPMARLTSEQVAEIRQRKAGGEKQIDLSRHFEVSPMTISRIVRGEAWAA